MHDTITGPVFQEMLIFGAASIAKENRASTISTFSPCRTATRAPI
ncbi:MAG: hypothetical protein ACLSHJ_05400 [Oscillospiraceae bacterium]